MFDVTMDSSRIQRAPTVAEHLATLLWKLGVRNAFGVCGREIVPVWHALLSTARTEREIATYHGRHETGAGFAAVGSWLQTGRPVGVFTTTGPGLTNVVTALETARVTGAKVILLSPLTPVAERGRLGIQETGASGYWSADLHLAGRLFDVVAHVESPKQLQALAGRLAAGLAGDDGFMAHIAIPTNVQAERTFAAPKVPVVRRSRPAPAPEVADEVADLLAAEPFAVWVGWGARRHAQAIHRLLDITGAPAICSPRALGVVDRHASFLGVTGNGGSETLAEELAACGVQRMLVLGSRLAEATSGWLPGLVPSGGFIHVDLDPGVFGQAYPDAPSYGVQSGVGELVDALLARADKLVHRSGPERAPQADAEPLVAAPGTVHPVALMAAIQRVLVDGTDIPIIADASSAMFYAARYLRYPEPGRWFVEGHVGAMGAAGALVVGAAGGRGGPAAALCGDGSMHMQDEISTAVKYGLPAIWIVLNDGGLGIVRSGMGRNGWPLHDADYPAADFAAVAQDKGAEGVRVTAANALDAALSQALEAGRPFVVDVVIDPSVVPPMGARGKR
ncbi:MAG: thiamine pyrophosphate-binding protein [Solirubrobacteraceae bacterium]|nr:thiamine pyrophosphate-binding protein [Solirubrobacteraceae bacterium]